MGDRLFVLPGRYECFSEVVQDGQIEGIQLRGAFENGDRLLGSAGGLEEEGITVEHIHRIGVDVHRTEKGGLRSR